MSEKIVHKFFEVYEPYLHSGTSGCSKLVKGIGIVNKLIETYDLKTFFPGEADRVVFHDFGNKKELIIELYTGKNNSYKFIEIYSDILRVEDVKKSIEYETGFILKETKNAHRI